MKKPNKKILKKIYCSDKLSMKEISKRYFVSAQTIMRLIHKYNLPINKRGKSWNYGKTYKEDSRILAKDKHPRTKNKKYYNSDFKRLRKDILPCKCSICENLATMIHHKDEDIMNNDKSNLIPMCLGCHAILHNKKRGITIAKFNCLWCRKDFEVLHLKKGIRNFCSLSCKSLHFYYKSGRSPLYERNNKNNKNFEVNKNDD